MMSEKLLDIKDLAAHYASGKDTVKGQSTVLASVWKRESLWDWWVNRGR